MSAWPQAVWIVKKINARLDVSTQIEGYVNLLNQMNGRINTAEANLNAAILFLEGKTTTFISEKNHYNLPTNPPSNYGNGTLWLIQSS